MLLQYCKKDYKIKQWALELVGKDTEYELRLNTKFMGIFHHIVAHLFDHFYKGGDISTFVPRGTLLEHKAVQASKNIMAYRQKLAEVP